MRAVGDGASAAEVWSRKGTYVSAVRAARALQMYECLPSTSTHTHTHTHAELAAYEGWSRQQVETDEQARTMSACHYAVLRDTSVRPTTLLSLSRCALWSAPESSLVARSSVSRRA